MSRFFCIHLRWSHLLAFVVLWVLSAAATAWILRQFQVAEWQAATMAIILGPMAGGYLRGQSCCVEFSLSLLPLFGGIAAVSTLAQFIRTPPHPAFACLRWLLFVLGTLSWFSGALLSYGHALS